MKIDKSTQKEYISHIKDKTFKKGYKKIQNTIYKIENGNVIFVDFLIVNAQNLVYRINIKKDSYDKIFWEILSMEENLKKGASMKVNCAFAAPSILISKGSFQLSTDVTSKVEYFVDIIEEEIKKFLDHNCVEDVIISNEEFMDKEILQCLFYLESKQIAKAIEVAKKQLENGNMGRFENEGKCFFERVILRYS